MTANDPFNMTNQTTTALALVPEDNAQAEAEQLEQCLHQMEAAADDLHDLSRDAFQAALTFGHAAGHARELLKPSGGFGAWADKFFGPKSSRPMTIQWIRKCINAAEAHEKIERLAPGKRDLILERYNTVEKLASALGALASGEDLLKPTPKLAPTPKAAKLKIDRSADAGKDEDDDQPDTGAGANMAADLAKREAACDRREKILDAKEKRLNEWEADLTRRAALINASPAIDVTARDVTADKGEASLERARAAARAPKAPSKATSAATTAAKPADKGVPAPAAKTAPSARVRAKAPGAAALLPTNVADDLIARAKAATKAPTPAGTPTTAPKADAAGADEVL